MIAPLLFTLARVIIAGFLFWAASRPSLNSNLFFLIPVFAVAAWGIYRGFQEEEWSMVIFYGLMALVFNPFGWMSFEKGTWKLIDISAGILLPFSILLLDSAPFEMLLNRPGAKPVKTIATIVFAISWSLFGCVIIYYSAKEIVSVAKVKIYGKETEARITRVTHGLYYTEDADDFPVVYDIYITEYTFETDDGQSVNGYAELYKNPVSNLDVDEFKAQYANGYEVDKENPVPLRVEYETGNPANNRALSHREGVFSIIFGWVSLTIISLWPVGSGFIALKRNILQLIPKGQK